MQRLQRFSGCGMCVRMCVCAIRGVSVADNVDAHVDVVSDDGDQEDDLQLDLTLGVISQRQSRSQDFTLRGGGTGAARVHFFLKKKLTPFFSRRRQNLTSPSSGVHIFEAHRTLLIKRTVLLY